MKGFQLLLILSLIFNGEVLGGERTKESITKDLEEVARIATIMLDGDVCQRIMTDRALKKLFLVDPQDKWAASDNFDVNHEPYLQTKKTLIRLARLLPYPVDCNLWMSFKDHPEKVQVLIRNRFEMSQFWTWGALIQDIPPEMKEVLTKGRPQTVARAADFISVLTPVHNSLGEIVGLIEVVSRVNPNPEENVK